MVLSLISQLAGAHDGWSRAAAGTNRSTGSGSLPLKEVKRRCTPRRAPETSPGRRASIQRAGSIPKGDGAGEESPRESRPASARVLPEAASAPVRDRFGRRAAAVVAPVTPPCHRNPAGGPIQAVGVGDCAAAALVGIASQKSARSFAVARVAPVRRSVPPAGPAGSVCHEEFIITPPRRFWFGNLNSGNALSRELATFNSPGTSWRRTARRQSKIATASLSWRILWLWVLFLAIPRPYNFARLKVPHLDLIVPSGRDQVAIVG
jgi:hypothetical protein